MCNTVWYRRRKLRQYVIIEVKISVSRDIPLQGWRSQLLLSSRL